MLGQLLNFTATQLSSQGVLSLEHGAQADPLSGLVQAVVAAREAR